MYRRTLTGWQEAARLATAAADVVREAGSRVSGHSKALCWCPVHLKRAVLAPEAAASIRIDLGCKGLDLMNHM